MKRNLLLAALFAAPLYLRQREVERRQREWREQQDAALNGFAKGLLDWADGTNKNFEKGWKRLLGEIERAGRL